MKQSLLSSWRNVGRTLAMTVGSPSAHRRGIMLKLLSVLVLILTIGIGQMWGAAIHTLDFTAKTASNSSYNQTYWTYGSWSVNQCANNNGGWGYVRCGGKGGSANNSESTLTSNFKGPKIESKVGSIVISHNGRNNSNVTNTSVTITAYSNSTYTTSIWSATRSSSTISISNGTADTIQFTGLDVAKDSYYIIAITSNIKGKSNYGVDITKVEFYAPVTCTSLTMSTVTATPGNARIDLSWPTVANASSYTVTCKRKSDNSTAGISIGSVSGSGPKTCAITGLTNGTEYTWSVMPVGTGSYCAENTPATGDATPNQTHTITYYDKDGSHTTTLADGTNIATALNALYGVGGPTSCNTTDYEYFVGWKDGEISGTATSVTLLSTEVVNATTAAKTYYAVWSDKDPSSGSWTQVTSVAVGDHVVIAQVDDGTKEMTGFNTTVTTANNFGTGADFTTSPAGTMVWTVEAGNSEGSFAFKNSSNYYLNLPSDNNYLNGSTTKNNNSSWTIATSSSRAAVTNVNTTTRKLMWNKNNTRFSTYAGKSHGNNSGQFYYYVVFYKQTAVSAKYITTCCEPLGSINGSVSWTNAAATVSWDDVNGFGNTWALKYKKTTDEDTPAKWSTYNGSFGSANNRKSNSTAISNLEAGTSYDFKVTGTYSGSAYCAQDYTFTFSSVVPKITTGAVSGASTYKVGYGPGTKQTFTVSAVGLDDDLTVSAPTNFLVCKTENGTYTSSVTLNHSEGTVASTTLYVQLAANLAVNDYNANVGISGGGAESVNVAVSGVVSPDCSDPTINSHPSGATYNMNATAAALSVTASHNGTGPAETYQWYSNTANNNTTGTPIAGETNSTYTPSTADAGTKYYYCIVYSGACSVTSNVAAVTVNTPIITIGGNKISHDFESKAIGSENEVTISVSGTTLANGQNISLALSGAGASAFALSTNSLTASNGTVSATDVTITYTAVAGASEATLTISSEGAVSKEITLSGTGKYQATFIANGNSENILVDGEGKLVLPASNPSSCNGSYSTFIGWYSTAAGSNGDPTTNIASCGTKAVTTHVLESNETYYAVWGNGALSADDVKQVTLDFTSNTDWGFPESTHDAAANEEISYTKGDYTVKIKGDGTNKYYFNSTNNQLLLGKTSGVYLKLPAFNFAVSKIVATEPTGQVSGKITWNIYSGETAVSTELTGCSEGGTFVIDENYREKGTIYQIQLTNANNLQFKTLEIYSPGAGATGFISSFCSTWDADPVVTYAAPADWTVGGDAVSVSISGTTHGTASYVSSAPSIISVDAETGAISPEAIGSATITVTWSGDGYCDKAVTTAPVTVHGYVDVTFKKNGGSGTDDQTQSVEVGVSTALTSLATLGYGAPDCKEFGGWATTSDGEAVYADGASISANEATTLWAVWNTKTLSVAQGTGTAVGCEGDAFTFASSVACGGNVTITSSPDATHKAPFTITVLPDNAYEEIDGNVIKNVTKPITSISVSYTAKTSYTITWKVNDAPYAPHQEEEDGKVNGDALVYEGNTITTLPTAPEDNTLGCANKFMGWSTLDYKSVKKTASDYSDLFTIASGAPEISKATTFYAVFATAAGESSWTELINEEFDNTQTTDDSDAIESSTFANFSGATNKAYKGAGGLKLGASSSVGYVTTKELDLSKDFKVSLKAKAYGTDASTLYVKVGSETQSVSTRSDDPLTSEFKTFVFEFDATEEETIEIGTSVSNKGRAYIDDVVISKKAATISDYVTECAAVEAPTFTPAAGTYNEAQSVELSSTTVGADIYYTTNGSTPTSGSTAYSGAIAVNQNMTIKAIAIKGSDESDVAEAAYVLKVATPEISGATSFVTPATVTITATGADAIYYTDDDSDPASSGTKKTYSGSFAVDANTTIKAIAVKENWTSSDVASETFTKITPLTVDAALTNINALDNNGTIADQYVKGLISQIVSYNSGNTITYYISDDGTTSSQLQVFKGSAGVANGGNAFTSADDLKVGEEVVVFGTLKKYKSGSNPVIPEFVNPNEIVAYRPYSPMAWSANAYTAELGGSSNVFPSLSGTAGLTISYSSSDPTKASFADASVYDITLNAVTGETPITITATSAANEQYVQTSVSYNLTVAAAVTRYSLSYQKNGGTSDATDSDGATETNLPNPLPTITKAGYNFGGWYTDSEYEHLASAGAALTENTTLYAQWEDPYTVSVALAKSATTGVYVQGVISTITEVSTQHGNATYKISADGTASGEMIVYRGKFTGNVSFTAADQIQLGDEVVIYGDLTEHDNAMQLAQGNYIYSLDRPTFDVESVTLPSTANVRVGKIITLTAEIAPTNATNKNVTWSVKSGDAYAEVSAAGVVTGLAEGTAVIEVETEDGGFKAQCTVTVAAGLPTFTEDDHEWIKVSNASKLVAGRFYVIAREAANYTMTKNIDSYAGVATSTIENGVIASNALGSNTAIFELGGTSSAWTLTEVSTDAVLGATTGKNFSWEDNQEWTIAIDEDKDVSITNTNSSCGVICYNTSATPRRFKPYADASTTCPLPQLYMWAELSHSVTFDANGGVVESVPGVERTDEGKIIIPATEPTHSDISKAFGGWYKSDVPATLYNAGDEFETNVDVTLYAKWNTVPTYTVTYVPGGTGTVPAVASYRAGQKVQVVEAELSNPGYSFAGWTVKDAEQIVLPLDEENKFDMPASNVTITAVWSRISSQKWKLVEQGDELVIDAEYVIAYNSNTVQKALGAISSSVGTAINVTIDGDYLKGSEAMKILTLKKGKDNENYAFKNGDNYLTWSSGNSLNESTTLDNASSWTIEIGENNKVDIKNVGTTTRYLQYNTGSPRFACYTNTQQKVLLFKKVANLIVEDEQTKTATQVNATDITVKEDGKLTINVDADEKEIGDITVEDGGELIITGSKHIKANNVYLSSTMASGKSSQMSGALAQLDIQGEVYFDITLGAGGTAEKWHAFTVPFPVDAINGIYDLDGNKLTNEVNYAIMDYHGDIRATGAYGWKKYRSVMVPGTFYLMTVDGERTTYRFKKTADGALVAENSKQIYEYPKSGDEADNTDAGWNGVGNPNLFYGKVNAEVQVLDPENYVYVKKDPNSTNFVVGTPFFYQAAGNGSIAMLDADAGANYAPRRAAANGIEKIKVAFGNEDYTDYLDVSASEEALNEYQIGKDLVKMTMTNTPSVAQIFGMAYNTKLCMVNTPLVNNKAEVALELYAPVDGEYTISAEEREDATVYLLYEGRIIWNLSAGAYTSDFVKGNNAGYGIRVVKAPKVTTGIENEPTSDSLKGRVSKVVIDNNVFILRDGQMFDVTGKMAK